jgi:hypothetical protein
MGIHLSRLRHGELIAAVSALLLLLLLLLAPWYGSRTGWQGLTGLRWLAALTIAGAFALASCQAALRAPAVPAALAVVVTVLAFLTVLWLLVDVAVHHPAHQRVWAVVGLLAAGGMLVGAFRSLRQEGIREVDGPGEIPLVSAGREAPS